MKNSSSSSRRQYFKSVFSWTAGLSLFSVLGHKIALAVEKVYKKENVEATKENPTAKALQYVEVASLSKVRTAEKQGLAAAKQFCDNCSLYKNEGLIEGTKDKAGECLMFQNQPVTAKGWCTAWIRQEA